MEEGREPTRESDYLSNFRSNVERAHRNLDQRAGKPSGQVPNPQTPPSRFLSSNFSSPGSIIGKEEDAVIIELNQRYLLAGIEGESDPQCKITFNPNTARRVGDYRAWSPEHKQKQENLDNWGQDYELWRNNIEGLDLGLVGDRLERAVREAYNKHLLLDAGVSRLVLVIPSVVPHPVLDTLLSTLFQRWSYPAVTLLPAPTMAAISAGLRSALVIDIGWEETVITSVCEYREIQSQRSTRAMKQITKRFAVALREFVAARMNAKTLELETRNPRLGLDFVEQILARTLPSTFLSGTQGYANDTQESTATVQDDVSFKAPPDHRYSIDSHEVEWPSGMTTEILHLPKSMVANVVDETLFDEGGDIYPDDHELALPLLAFKSLLTLSSDQRSNCMSRVVFTGEGSKIPQIRRRVLQRLRSLSDQKSWSEVKGQHIRPKHTGSSDAGQARNRPADAKHDVESQTEKDYVEELVRKQKSRRVRQAVPAELREVNSLGSWAGASLLTNLKVRGFVEIERERFLSHGLTGASRDTQISVIPQPQRMSSFGITKPTKLPDRTSWTLAGWG